MKLRFNHLVPVDSHVIHDVRVISTTVVVQQMYSYTSVSL
jgi:hypothetical protein